MAERERILVTGLGAVTPFGVGVDALWSGLTSGTSAVRQIRSFDASELPVQIAGEVPNFVPGDHMDAKAAKRMDRFAQFAVAASREAVASAGLDLSALDADRVGIVMNTGGGGLPSFEQSIQTRISRGGRAVSIFAIPLYIPNMVSSQVSIALGTHGPTVTGVGACAAGVMAVIDAVRLLEMGEVDVVIAGASEALLTPIIVAGFAATGALSGRNHDPAGACRPFSSDRDGTVLGEGACVLVLEREAHAVRRGATAIAHAAGGAMTSDAYHITAPAPDGKYAAKAMAGALRASGLGPEEIGYLSAHGTGSKLGDHAEYLAIASAFGDMAREIPISSTKSMAGHLIGAAGALSALACVLSIRDGVIPPTINLHQPDPELPLDFVPNTTRKRRVAAAMVNGFAFGGQNASFVFRGV